MFGECCSLNSPVKQTIIVALQLILCVFLCLATPSSNIRQLMQNHQENQDIVSSLGTVYEIVYPRQYRQDWIRGLSTREISHDKELVSHLKRTTVLIESVQYKFHLDLELNTNLLAPTLLKILRVSESEEVIEQDVENCYYHGVMRNHTGVAAVRTCFGLTGIIYFENEIFLIYPLHGDDSINHPHVLYHYTERTKEHFLCGNQNVDESFHCMQDQPQNLDTTDFGVNGNKYVELAVFLDMSYLKKYDMLGKDPVAEAIQIINAVDLLYRPANTYVSVVYLEMWMDDPFNMTSDIDIIPDLLRDYVAHKLSRLSIDAAHLLTFNDFEVTGTAISDSICTPSAVALTKIENPYKPHLSSMAVSHMLGHNLGMYHDHSCCHCKHDKNCLMRGSFETSQMYSFSSCSLDDYHRTLNNGYGECLLNMPSMRESICGNRILEKDEECDCGSTEECSKHDSCCDPSTCQFIQHAECSSGPCCKKCKLLSADYMCRPSRGECDIPDFCDGKNEMCPTDIYRKNGATCNGGFGYCYLGSCPSNKQQCENLWGFGADSADFVCYQRLNMQGTPNGNCGPDGKGGLIKCDIEHSYCGSLQCQLGNKAPITTQKPVRFVIHKINVNGKIHECKAIPSMSFHKALNFGLVEDGTKCGYQQFCLNSTCVKIKTDFSRRCPFGGFDHLICSGHGVCTNLDTCFCDKEWTGEDCSIHIHDSDEERNNFVIMKNVNSGNETLKITLKETVAISTTVTSLVIGIPLIGLLIYIFFKSKDILAKRREISKKQIIS